jgi:A/G-specific adenine glycosylase
MIADFTKKLLLWDKKKNTRSMPWKGEKDPYKIWLSEIILQQTRVEQGWAYYENFIKTFPTIQQLAKAPEKKIFKMWEGLGYYNRCKNLIATAKKITKEYNGIFPQSYEEILQLKGVGTYTASAIASFAFNLPKAVVDGNVERIISRYFGINTPVDTVDGKKIYQLLAEALLDEKKPGIYNQAIMDFGAVICKPQNPLCAQCPQQQDCQAYQMGVTEELPIKSKKTPKKNRWFYYLVIDFDGLTYIHKRNEKDIWQNLYEFVLVESKQQMEEKKILQNTSIKKILGDVQANVKTISEKYKQQLSHQTIHLQFIHISIPKPLKGLKGYERMGSKEIKKAPFPQPLSKYISQNMR